MSLFVVGFVVGISLMSFLCWRRIVAPLQNLAENVEKYLDAGDFPASAHRKHPEVHRLQQLVLEVISKLESGAQKSETEFSREDFLSIVSHELRTPLTSIKGSLNLLTSNVISMKSNQADNLIQISESEVNRMIELVNNFIDYNRLKNSEIEFDFQWVDVANLLATTQRSVLGLQQQTNVSVFFEPTANLEVFGDQNYLKQLLVNLISNAIKHTPSGGNVIIGTMIVDNFLRIYVSDCGRGIAQSDQKKIFQKFTQLKDSPGGTGLGLTICQSIATAHKGRMGVESVPGNGATFYFETYKYKHTNPNKMESA